MGSIAAATQLKAMRGAGRERPRGKDVNALAQKHAISRDKAYRLISETFGPSTYHSKSNAKRTVGEQKAGKTDEAARTGKVDPLTKVRAFQDAGGKTKIGVDYQPVDPTGMPDIFKVPLPGAAPAPGVASGVPGVAGVGVGGQTSGMVVDPADMAKPMVETMTMMYDRFFGDPDQVFGDPGPFTDREKKALEEAWGPALIKYLPYYARYFVEINLLLSTMMVFGPRVRYRMQLADQAKKALKAGQRRPPPAFRVQVDDEPHEERRAELSIGEQIERQLRNQGKKPNPNKE